MKDLMIAIYLWDRLGWGPSETEQLTPEQLKLLLEVLRAQKR